MVGLVEKVTDFSGMEKSVGVCFIVIGSGQFGLSGGGPWSQLHGGAFTLSVVSKYCCSCLADLP